MKKVVSTIYSFYLILMAGLLNAVGADSCNVPPSSAVGVHTKPVIEITSPENGGVVDTSSIPVSGTLTSPATVTINGTAASSGITGFSAGSVSLVPGLNTLTAVAANPEGLVSRHSIQVWLLGDVDLEVHTPGKMADTTSAVPELEEDDPVKLSVLVNDDNDDNDPSATPAPMDNDDTSIHEDDDDIVKLTLKSLPSSINSGTLELSVTSGASDVNVFNTDGSALLSDWNVDLASPSGELAGLATADVDLFVEGVNLNTDVSLKYVYKDTDGHELCSDEVHLGVLKVGFIDEEPDYSQGGDETTPSVSEDNDSDNYFLRKNNDYENLDIYYRILPDTLQVSDVRINIYDGDTSSAPIETIVGEKDGASFKAGDDLHVTWTPGLGAQDGDPGMFRAQLEIYIDEQPEPFYRTSIDDADESTAVWDCPQECLAIHDLLWKHRLIVNSHPQDLGPPSSISEFMLESGNHVKEWVTGQNDPTVHPEGYMPGAENTYFDLFDDEQVTNGDLSDYTQAQLEILATDPGEETVYFSSVGAGETGGASNYVFLQFWMFENYSRRPFNIGGLPADPNVQHEGDMEHCQIAIRIQDAYEKGEKSKWVQPFGATASQHYYAQTLKWDLNDGSAAANAHTQDHVEHLNNRLAVYIALGAHATYFASDNDIEVPDFNSYLGTQDQYDPSPDSALDRTGNGIVSYTLLPLDGWLGIFNGRWGYLDRDDPDSTENGPAGPPHRHAKISSSEILVLRSNPRELHNRARKTSQEQDMFIPEN